MAPKEKAKEIFNKMYLTGAHPNSIYIRKDIAKRSALIAVGVVLSFQEHLCITEGSIAYQYWQDVKAEIEKI